MKRQKIKYLSAEEKKALIDVLRDRKSAVRDYFLFSLMLHTGLRLAEVASLTVGHIKDRKTLHIVGKGNKPREIPLNTYIRKHIASFLRYKRKAKEDLFDTSPLFVSRNKNNLSVRAIQRALDKWLKESKIENHYSPHALRHTFGTELYRKCKNIRLVQDIMGHSDISTTMIYTHITKEEMEEAVELL